MRNTPTTSVFLNVPNASNTVLLAALAVPGASTVMSVTWAGTPLTRLASHGSGAPNGCRLETWFLRDPKPGNDAVTVTLNGANGWGVGAATYSNVDRGQPQLSNVNGSNTAISLVPNASQIGAVFGSACGSAADRNVTAAAGQTQLWDFTETSLVGVGAHRLAAPWQLGWTLQRATAWAATGVILREAGSVSSPPDAGSTVDSNPPPDAAAPAPVDASAPTPDVSLPTSDASAPTSDLPGAMPDAAVAGDVTSPTPDTTQALDGNSRPNDASVIGERDSAASDVKQPSDAAATPLDTSPINLRVGCACEMGQSAPGGASGQTLGLLLGMASVARIVRRRRQRTRDR